MSAHKCGFSELIGIWDTPVSLIFVLTLTFLQHVTLTEPKDTGHGPSLTICLPMCQCSNTHLTSPQTTHNIPLSDPVCPSSLLFVCFSQNWHRASDKVYPPPPLPPPPITNLSRTCDRAHKAHRAPLPLTQLLQALPVFLLQEERIALLILRTPQLQDADGWIAQLEVVSSNQRSCWLHYFLQNIPCSIGQE